jgi:hypothetical protein
VLALHVFIRAEQPSIPAKEGRAMTATTSVTTGFLKLTHHSFALLGLLVMFGFITLTVHPAIRQEGEVRLMSWLQGRQLPSTGMEIDLDATERATASNPKKLPKQQAALAFWLSRKYNIAPEPLSALVVEAYEIGQRTHLAPTLILAVMAVESGFNPFAQSHVGAQGLMQVMTQVHSDKYADFGGKLAAFDPISNLRVGAKVLKECIARAGSIEGGLKFYVGAANLEADGGYAAKVLAEHTRLQSVADGKPVPMNTPSPVANPITQMPTNPTTPERVASVAQAY